MNTGDINTGDIVKTHHGRKPNTWNPGLTSESLRAFRDEYHVSRRTLSRLLDVSPTAIQNWEGGLVAPSSKTQGELERIMADAKRTGVVHQKTIHGGSTSDTLTATGQIMVAYMAKTVVTQDGLPELIQAVRLALS